MWQESCSELSGPGFIPACLCDFEKLPSLAEAQFLHLKNTCKANLPSLKRWSEITAFEVGQSFLKGPGIGEPRASHGVKCLLQALSFMVCGKGAAISDVHLTCAMAGMNMVSELCPFPHPFWPFPGSLPYLSHLYHNYFFKRSTDAHPSLYIFPLVFCFCP